MANESEIAEAFNLLIGHADVLEASGLYLKKLKLDDPYRLFRAQLGHCDPVIESAEAIKSLLNKIIELKQEK